MSNASNYHPADDGTAHYFCTRLSDKTVVFTKQPSETSLLLEDGGERIELVVDAEGWNEARAAYYDGNLTFEKLKSRYASPSTDQQPPVA